MDNNRIDSLDSIRGIASLIVVIFHCLLSFMVFYKANYFNEFSNEAIALFTLSPLHTIWAGKEAVLLFFVLSGFVLSIPFYKGEAPKYRVYIVRRFFRIYIPYIVIMAISVFLVTFFLDYKNVHGLSSTYNNRWDHTVSFKAIISYILMLDYDTANVNGVVWTLYHEMRISIIFPLFLAIISRFKLVNSIILSLALNVCLFIFLDLLGFMAKGNFLSFLLPPLKSSLYYCTFFIFGAILSKYRLDISKLKVLNPYLKFMLFVLSLALINCRWVTTTIGIDNVKATDFISVLGILLLFSMILSSSKAESILTKKPLLWLGKISYSLYLIHIPILMMVTIFLSKFIPIELTFILVPIICLPIAHFTHKHLEMKANNIGKVIVKLIKDESTLFSKRKSA
ncbi:acyltransferase [Priestia megaterium]